MGLSSNITIKIIVINKKRYAEKLIANTIGAKNIKSSIKNTNKIAEHQYKIFVIATKCINLYCRR